MNECRISVYYVKVWFVIMRVGFKRQKDLRRCEYNFGVGVLHQVVFIFSLREVRANMKFLS